MAEKLPVRGILSMALSGYIIMSSPAHLGETTGSVTKEIFQVPVESLRDVTEGISLRPGITSMGKLAAEELTFIEHAP